MTVSNSGYENTHRTMNEDERAIEEEQKRKRPLSAEDFSVYRNQLMNEWSPTEAESIFIEVYVNTLDVSQAAKEAGIYHATARKWLRYPPIIEEVTLRLREMKVNPAEIVTNLGRIMRTDISDFIVAEEDEDGKKRLRYDLTRATELNLTYGIQKLSLYRDGSIKDIVLEDRSRAIEMLGRMLFLFPKEEGRDRDERSLADRLASLPFDRDVLAEELGKVQRMLRPAKVVIDGNVVGEVIPKPDDDGDAHE